MFVRKILPEKWDQRDRVLHGDRAQNLERPEEVYFSEGYMAHMDNSGDAVDINMRLILGWYSIFPIAFMLLQLFSFAGPTITKNLHTRKAKCPPSLFA